jgi:AraC family ethanolamine operon transcriptional activator
VYDDKKGEVRYESLFLPEADFSDIARSLAPGQALLSPGSATIHHGDPECLAAIQYEMDSVHRTGSLDHEIASHLLARTILFMVGVQSKSTSEKLTNIDVASIARRAQTFIEEHLDEPIRMEDLCANAGVGLRTLQRSFASYFQINPTAYIKARRLNSARRDLLSADSSRSSVTRIALDNGFSHLGRFSVEYHMHFGETARQTKARADG